MAEQCIEMDDFNNKLEDYFLNHHNQKANRETSVYCLFVVFFGCFQNALTFFLFPVQIIPLV